MKYASIDIGSNAVRLFVANVFDKKGELKHKKSTLVRIPIRLGADVFGPKNKISSRNEQRLIHGMIAFKNLMQVHEVSRYRACATSAFRESKNGDEVIKKIKKETGIQIDLISGAEEARVIYANQIEKLLDAKTNALYVDVGGGSTELSMFKGRELVISKSFQIGTVRLLQGSEDVTVWADIKEWIEEAVKLCQPNYVIGSGGNINKLVKLSNEKTGEVDKTISYKQLKELFHSIVSYSYEERISELDLNPDRADVIIPASKIFLAIMDWADVKKVFVPKIGLADGIVTELYKNDKFPYQEI